MAQETTQLEIKSIGDIDGCRLACTRCSENTLYATTIQTNTVNCNCPEMPTQQTLVCMCPQAVTT